MPLRLLVSTIHNKLTKRDYSFSIDDFFDLGIAVCVGVWIYTVTSWMYYEHEDGSNEGYSVPGTFDHYAYTAINKHMNGNFNMLGFLCAMIMMMWARFLSMM